MPNWCEGVLKLRGTKENLINFARNGLRRCYAEGFNYIKDMELNECIEEYKNSTSINIDECCGNTERRNWVHFDGSTRMFMECDLEWDFYKDVTTQTLYVKQAWNIDTDYLKSISVKYGIDIKIYAFERGMEFNRDIEIVSGEIIKDETIKFNDYKWECINPEIGG